MNTKDVSSEDTNSENTNSENTNGEDPHSENTKCRDTNSENWNSERIPGAIKLPLEDKFLDPQNVLTLLLTHRPSGKTVPRGIKENVAFVLENESNLVRNANGNRSRVMLTIVELGLAPDPAKPIIK